ncbi:MAG TPA: HNH endonuclease signature motif containing protein [Alphaproteobacteria bacterium]|nr:HNH endonuclease signature motif containing protein [Alphaproteobacteria bacterium]
MGEKKKQMNDITAVDVDDFSQVKECTYKDERYSVRDNGSVLRHQRDGKRARPNDNQWTFGKDNSANPYLHVSNIRVHRIVATAFHGEPPDPKYVVDHIDTNCRNNRPENLRWLSRLENALKNPATRKKIEYLCGSIEAFLENPSMLNELQGEPNFKWMRTVTPEEAKNCKLRMDIWASSNRESSGSTGEINCKSSFSERVYKPLQEWEVGLDREPGLGLALTPWCAQYMWRAKAYFPCCPQVFGDSPIDDYFQNIKVGTVFAYSDYDEICPKLIVSESVTLKNKASILVMCERADSNWSIVGIELDERSRHFIHFILGSYYSKDEANEAFRAINESTDFWGKAYSHAHDLR